MGQFKGIKSSTPTSVIDQISQIWRRQIYPFLLKEKFRGWHYFLRPRDIMLSLRRVIGAVLLGLFLQGCLSVVPKGAGHQMPLEGNGFTILPPGGEGWQLMTKEQVGHFDFVFGRKLDSPTHTMVASVTALTTHRSFATPEEFYSFVREAGSTGIDPRRFTVISSRIEQDNRFGPWSIFKHTLVEDRQAVNAAGQDTLLQRTAGYVLVHTTEEHQLVSIEYSERSAREEMDPDFEEQSRKFFGGLRLIKHSGSPHSSGSP